MRRLRPGDTLGILGGGQLGRMTAVAAQRLGLRTLCLDPEPDAPAGQICEHLHAAWDDPAALAVLADRAAVITVEQEAIPRASLDTLASRRPLFPHPQVVATCADRLDERRFVVAADLGTAPWAPLVAAADLPAARAVGFPARLKTARGGYDGKGQVGVSGPLELDDAWASLGHRPCLVERLVDLEREISVIVARGTDGRYELLGPIENHHERGVLDVSSWPARVAPHQAVAARAGALRLAERFGLVGLLTVEYFIERGGALLVNELAPRPHNSGHLSIEAGGTDQFEQLVRAVGGLPLGPFGPERPAAMANLLGDLWRGGEPPWDAVLAAPGVRLHLYGKAQARPGRKMGHLTRVAQDRDAAADAVLGARRSLDPTAPR